MLREGTFRISAKNSLRSVTLSSQEIIPTSVIHAVAGIKKILAHEIAGLGDQQTTQWTAIQQALRHYCTSTSDSILSARLFSLAQDLIDDPSFAALAQNLLRLIQEAKLPHAQKATCLLGIVQGQGGSFLEYASHTFQKLSHPENYGSMAIALAGASLAGKGLRVASHFWLRSHPATSLINPLARQGLSGTLAFLGEAASFPLSHHLGLRALGQSTNLENYSDEVVHGLKMMGTLNVAAFFSRNLHRTIHGVRDFSGMATRARTWAPYTHAALHGTSELGALTVLAYTEQRSEPLYHLLESSALMLNLRAARSLGNTLFPALSHLYQKMDLQAYILARNVGICRFDSTKTFLSHRLNHSPNASPSLAYGKKGSTREFGQDFLQARYETQGPGPTGSPNAPKFSQAVRDALVIPEDFYPSLKKEMEQAGAKNQSPLSLNHWKAFKKIVDAAALEKNPMDPKDAAYDLIQIMYTDLIDRIAILKANYPRFKIYHGKIKDLDRRLKDAMLGSTDHISIPLTIDRLTHDNFLNNNIPFLGDFQTFLNLSLTFTRKREALRLTTLVESQNILYVSFVNLAQYLEYFLNQAQNISLSYPRILPKLWITSGTKVDVQERKPLDQGRYFLISPFAQDVIHSGINPDLTLTVYQNKKTHPMAVAYHDMAHLITLSIFPRKIVQYQEKIAKLYEDSAVFFHKPEFTKDLTRQIYDFGGGIVDISGEQSFQNIFIRLFAEAIKTAEHYDIKDPFIKRFQDFIDQGLACSDTEQRTFFSSLDFYFGEAQDHISGGIPLSL